MIAFAPSPPRRPDAARHLGRRLAVHFGGSVAAAQSEPWASATFEGERHRIVIHVDADLRPLAGKLVRHVGEAEIALPGHILADCAVAGFADHGTHLVITLEALTIAAK
jgi:hypothetical protein